MLKMVVGMIAGFVVIAAVFWFVSIRESGKVETEPTETALEQSGSERIEVESAGVEQAPGSVVPKFDVIRIDADGNAVVAGQAAPGKSFEILLDGQVIATGTADEAGRFASLFSVPPTDAPRRLVLRVADGGEIGTRIAAAGKKRETSESAEGAPASEDLEADDASKTVESVPAVILPGAGREDAPAIVQPEEEELALLQPSAAGAQTKVVFLDRISYSDGGKVDLLGRAVPGRVVRVYADGEPVAEASVDPTGRWRAWLDAETGRRATLLRFDEIDDAGKVVSRIETSFTYGLDDAPEEAGRRTIEVSKGDYLWRIAERFYGKGIRYTFIFAENAELIRNPDLIYPGQVFTVPEPVNVE